MTYGGVTGYIDVAQVTLYVFWIFFAGLVYYLRREDKREGYPLVSEVPGQTEMEVSRGYPALPPPKRFRMYWGGDHFSPPGNPPRFPHGARAAALWPGAPLEPAGNPLVDGLGPASWANRDDEPDLTIDGKLKLVPLRDGTEYYVCKDTPDPRGMTVMGADSLPAGIVVDLWIDEIEETVRYLEVSLTLKGHEGKRVLLPQPFMRIKARLRRLTVRAILAEQFADVPQLRNPDQVTRLEEDKLVGYFGGGALYATARRSGPVL